MDFGLYAEDMQAFKVKYIYEKLRQEELESHVYALEFSAGRVLTICSGFTSGSDRWTALPRTCSPS